MKARKKFFTMFLSMLLVFTMMPLSAIPVTAASSTDPPPAALDQTKLVDETLTETDIQTETESTTTPEPPPASETPDGSQDLPDAETSVEPKTPPIAKALAGEVDYGSVTLNFPPLNNESRAITLYSGQYIVYCNASTPVLNAIGEPTDGYLVWYHEGILYLNGNLQDVKINLCNAKRFPPKQSVLVRVVNDVVMSGYDVLLQLQDGPDAKLQIDTGKSLTLNLTKTAQSPGRGYAIYGREGTKLTVCGGGELNINTVGRNEGKYYAGGIVLSGDLTLEDDGGSPYVNINVTGGTSGFNGDQAFGIDVKNLKVKDDSTLKITIESGRDFDPATEYWTKPQNVIQKNYAISAGTMEVLGKASVEIVSKKNVVTDVMLGGGDGTALKVDTEGYFNIWNQGNIVRYPETDILHTHHDHPYTNIETGENARVELIRAEQGVFINSESTRIEYWATEGSDCWAILAKEIVLGSDMYQGNCPYEAVQENGTEYYRGEFNYIWSPTGVATVKVSRGLIMDHEVPPGASSSVYFAKVIEPKHEDTHVVRKGDELKLTAPEGKGTFLYWYDALHPEGSGNGTSWTSATQTFSDIQQDMVLVPVRDPMTNGPTLSDVGYSVQWDKGMTKQTRYAYQDMTFEKEDSISDGSGGYRVMLVPVQLPRYGEKTYAAKDLKNRPLMGLRNARLYADEKAYGSTDELNSNHYRIPTGDYRIAYYDKDTNRCFISKPFTFNPPVAPPYISPGSGISEDNNHVPETVTITVERNKHIEYRVWNSSTNKWTSLQRYTGPIDVNVSVSNDVRIEAYAGSSLYGIKSEAYYAVRPTGTPTVKYGETNVGDGVGRYFYDSIELTVEAPEGYEVWYLVGDRPSESNMGNKVENGKVSITDSGSNGILFFKLAKVFTVDGVTYRKLSHDYAAVHLSKLTELPAPNVTVKTKDGGQTLIPSGNTYTMTENVVKVELTTQNEFPLNATIAYDTNGNARPTFSKSYTEPFEVRGAGTLAVFTLVPDADGGYEYTRKECIFKLAENLQTVPVSTYGGTAYYMNESGAWTEITGAGHYLKVGTKVRVVPNPPSGQVFKKWEIGNYSVYNIWGSYEAGDYHNPELIFHVPKPNYNYSHGSSEPLTLTIEAMFATAAEASISGQTKVDLVMKDKAVGESISLNYSSKEMRTISCQWWEGDSVGAPDDVLPGGVSFDPDKTYTVKVTIKANPGASFANTAGVEFGNLNRHFTVPNSKITRTGNTLTFTATPIRQINLTMPAPLTVGDPLPTIDDVGGLPEGVTVQALEWPYTTGNTVPETNYGTVRAALTLKTDGTHPILVNEYQYPTVNGEEYAYARNDNSGNDYIVTNGSTVTVGGIELPVKAKGVEVGGMVKSYNPGNATTIQLMQDGAEKYSTTIAAATGSEQMEQNFTFEAVAPGTYDLVVTKAAHLTYTIKNVVVGDTSLDLTWNSNGAISTITMLCGDIDGNEKVNAADLNIVWNAANFNKAVADANNQLTDVNGDGKVNAADLNIVWNAANFNKGTADCTFEY